MRARSAQYWVDPEAYGLDLPIPGEPAADRRGNT